jgi:hypothetical protein
VSRQRNIRTFDPQKVARYETENWVAYYRKQWLRLLRVSVGMVREAFGLPLPQAVYGAYLVGRAEIAAAPADNDIPLAEARMRRFYGLVKDANGETYDVSQAARLEVNWWVVHRRLFGQTENEPLVQALTDLYACLYQTWPDRVREAAHYRAEAMIYSDRWVNEGRIEGSPLIARVEEELCRSYVALRAAAASGPA